MTLLTKNLLLILLAGAMASCEPKEAESSLDAEGIEDANKYFTSDPKAEMEAQKKEEEDLAAAAEAARLIDANLIRVEIVAPETKLAAGSSMRVKVLAIYDDGSKVNISEEAPLSSSDNTIAGFTEDGSDVVTGRKPGTVEIATEFESFIDTQPLTVTSAELLQMQVSPKSMTLGSQKFRLTKVFTDGSTLDISEATTWTTNNANLARPDPEKGSQGYIEALAKGQFTLNANYGGLITSVPVQVNTLAIASIAISAENTTINVGTEAQLTATATYETGGTGDITESVDWSSLDEYVFTVNNEIGTRGLVTAGAGGVATIKATIDGVEGTIELTVTQDTFTSFRIEPGDKVVPVGLKQPFQLIGVRANATEQNLTTMGIWASSNEFLGSVSNNPTEVGTVTAWVPGQIVLSARYGLDVATLNVDIVEAAIVELSISSNKASVACGIGTVQFSATAIMSDESETEVTDSVVWSSIDANIISVSNGASSEGLATTLREGNTVVKAQIFVDTTGETILASKAFAVGAPALQGFDLSADATSVPGGTSFGVRAFGVFTCEVESPVNMTEEVDWSSDNTGALAVSNTTGSKGAITTSGSVPSDTDVIVTATKDAITITKTLTVRPKEIKQVDIAYGGANYVDIGDPDGQQLSVTGIFSDNSIMIITDNIASYPGYSIAYGKNWCGTNPNFRANIDATGKVTGVEEGGCSINASLSTPSGDTVVSAYVGTNIRSPCATGSRNGNYCYFVGDLGESCTDVCAGIAGTYHSVTEWLGTEHPQGSTNALNSCNGALWATNWGTVGGDGDTQPFDATGGGLGCAILDLGDATATRRYTDVPTTADAKHSLIRRFCACRDPD